MVENKTPENASFSVSLKTKSQMDTVPGREASLHSNTVFAKLFDIHVQFDRSKLKKRPGTRIIQRY